MQIYRICRSSNRVSRIVAASLRYLVGVVTLTVSGSAAVDVNWKSDGEEGDERLYLRTICSHPLVLALRRRMQELP